MTDDLGLVVHALDGAVGDALVEVGQDVLLMAAQHPGEIAHGLEPGMSGPPEPLLQEALGPALALVLPAFPEALLEQVGPHRLEAVAHQLVSDHPN